jgi:hypothetical protein
MDEQQFYSWVENAVTKAVKSSILWFN